MTRATCPVCLHRTERKREEKLTVHGVGRGDAAASSVQIRLFFPWDIAVAHCPPARYCHSGQTWLYHQHLDSGVHQSSWGHCNQLPGVAEE